LRPVEGSIASVAFPLETERLLLRPVEPGDADWLSELHGDAELLRWIPWGPRDRAEVEATIERKLGVRERGEGLGLVGFLRDGGEPVGDYTLQIESAEHRCAEIGFMMLARFHGQGLAYEASRELLRIAFDELGMHRVIARLEPRNDPSWRLLERLGMRREAHFLENEWIKGEWQSEYVYALLDREWEHLR
jgi:RimJ/RimL family protein N-acetyltransferase